MKRTKPVSAILAAALATALILSGCQIFSSEGQISLSITDAPVDADNVAGVHITISSIEYNRNGEWEQFEEFTDSVTYDLLELTDGETGMLGTLSLPAGEYTQLRFLLDAPDEGSSTSGNPGSYVSFNDSSDDAPLFVPSGAQTGYKAQAEEPFSVPANDVVSITVDFDVRQALVQRGASGSYILKPVLRIIVNDQAGSISGAVTYAGSNSLTVFAYEDETYNTDEPSTGDGFPNAVTSDLVELDEAEEDLVYVLSFLAAGTYDLVVAELDANGDLVADTPPTVVEDVAVVAGDVTSRDIEI